MREAVIVAMGRSPVGKAPKGTLKNTRPEDLGTQVLKGVLGRIPALDKKDIDDVIVGCSMPEAEQGLNIARNIVLKAELPSSIPGQTVNRFCSSGLQTIATAANSIMAGQADVIVAGGIESMSTIPMGGNAPSPDPDVIETDPGVYIAMGHTAERVADQYGVSREDQDMFALRSHQKAVAAIESGKFDDEIIPIRAVRQIQKNDEILIDRVDFTRDEGARKGLDIESLARLRTVFKVNGRVTAGTSSQLSDGAAFVVVMSKEKAQELNLKPIARFVSFAVAGVDPTIMGVGPIAAIPKALKIANLDKDDIELIELNEAFSSQSLACIRDLGLNEDIINVNGGAIALGHPLGATGAILTVKLISEMIRQDKRFGLVSMCIGGGMGAAGVFEVM